MNTFLRDLALAHQQHEGFYPGSISQRQNNPGNLRSWGTYPIVGGFVFFPSYTEGFNALMTDLRLKITGVAGSVKRYLQGTGKAYAQLVFQEYVSIYAPSADKNNPIAYCDALCKTLASYHIHPQTSLATLSNLIEGEIAEAPDPPPASLTLEQRLRMAQNALQWSSDTRATILLRLIARIKKSLAKSPIPS